MPYEKLLRTGKIKEYTAQPKEVQQLLDVAGRDLGTALKNLEDAPDWAYSIAYNSILQASRALMLYEGYRPRGGEQHATVVEFIRERLGQEHLPKTRLFDQMRRKRHRVIYEVAGIVSKSEAEQAVTFAKEYLAVIREQITGQMSIGVD